MRRTLGGKWDAVTREWRTLHNEKRLPLTKYDSGDKIKQMSWASHIASMRTVDVLTGSWWEETQGKRQLGRSRRIWKDEINMDLQEVGWEAWIGLIWHRKGTGGGRL